MVPGTLHDSPYVLDGLLEHQTELQPRQLMTDSVGYSDIVFGLFWLLGFQFSPRFICGHLGPALPDRYQLPHRESVHQEPAEQKEAGNAGK